MTFDKTKYNNEFNKRNYTGVSFRLNSEKEANIIEHLKKQENLKEYICKLVSADMKRIAARSRRIMNKSDRNLWKDYQRYPYEVIEDLPYDSHYTVGFAEDVDNAALLLAEYARRTKNPGALHIIHREYDPDLNVVRSIEVRDEIL